MSRKIFTQIPVLILFVLAFLGTPFHVQAGGVCGGAYVVDPGETLDKIAANCGTTVAAILAANPGISGTVSTGQVVIVPGSNYIPGTPVPVPSTPVPNTTYNTYYNYYTNNYYNNSSPNYGNGTYVVKFGDTFSGIAAWFGVSINALWAANPNIANINLLYVGQVIYVPNSPGSVVVSTATNAPSTLSYGTVPFGSPMGKVKLSPNTSADIYVSLQGTTKEGNRVINEYTVTSSMTVKVPAGSYVYVAWVGGQKFSGQFNISGDSDHTISFYDKKVVAQ